MSRPVARAIEVAAAVYFVLACAALFRFTADDAFIVQRYATQFARGHGLVFNVGERVSALTSPLHAVILTALTVLVPFPLVVYKIAGALAVLASLLYAGRELFADVGERALFFSATLGSPFIAMWAVGGLETPLLLTCLTVLMLLAWRATTTVPSTSELSLFFIVSAFAGLLRHDSIVWVAPLAAGVLARHWRRSAPGVFAGAVTVGAWLVFAWSYYGDVLPTSFYAKVVEVQPPLLRGPGYLLSFAIFCLLPMMLLRRPQSLQLPTGAWLSVPLFLALAAAVGHVHMMFGYRFYVPVLPSLVAFCMRLTRPFAWIRRWVFVPLLAINAVTLLIVSTYTVNPTIFHPSLFEPHYGFLSRLASRGLAYEYTKEGAWGYGDFIDALRRTGRAVLADAEARGISDSARLGTMIAGATATEIPDVYIYDNLVGVRRNCPTLQLFETYSAADYFELIVPRFGPLDRQLGTLKSVVIAISDIEFEFDGRKERLVAYFNPAATHTPVPAKLHDPCPPGRK